MSVNSTPGRDNCPSQKSTIVQIEEHPESAVLGGLLRPPSERWSKRELPSSVEEGCPKGGVVLSKPLLDLLTTTRLRLLGKPSAAFTFWRSHPASAEEVNRAFDHSIQQAMQWWLFLEPRSSSSAMVSGNG